MDLASFLCGDPGIARIERMRMPGLGEYAAQVSFADGSLAQILCVESADERVAKERIEAHAGGITVTIDDYRTASVLSNGRRRALPGAGKGHAEEIGAFLDSLATGTPPVPLDILLPLSRALLHC